MTAREGFATVAAVAAGVVISGALLLRRRKAPDPRPVALVVDIGTSSIRCSAYFLPPPPQDGEAHTGSRRVEQVRGVGAHDSGRAVSNDGTGDMAAIRARVEAVVSECLRQLREQGLAPSIRAVGFACFVMNLVGVDVHGEPVTRVMTYASHDPGTAAHASVLRSALQEQEEGGVRALEVATGTTVHPAYFPAQLLRLNESDPDVVGRVAKWQTMSSYLLSRWTGRPFCGISYSEASWTGMLDTERLDWCERLLCHLPVSKSQLPPVCDVHDVFACVDGDPAAAGEQCPRSDGIELVQPMRATWPELAHADVRWFAGVGDGAAANIGSKCTSSSRVAVTVGTSAAVRVVVPRTELCSALSSSPESQPSGATGFGRLEAGLWCYCVDSTRCIVGGALTDGGSVLEWARRVFGIKTSEFNAILKSLSRNPTKGSTALHALPFLNGERAVGWHSGAHAAIAGLSWSTTREEIVRALIEAVTFRLYAVFRRMEPMLPADAVIVTSGGAMKCSPLWRQMLADVTGRDVVCDSESESTSAGVAVVISEHLSGVRGVLDLDLGNVHKPCEERTKHYRALFEQHREMYAMFSEQGWLGESCVAHHARRNDGAK